jgi:DNA-binding NarL/FixJ family response regulator
MGRGPRPGQSAAMKVFVVEDSLVVLERLGKMLRAVPGVDVVGCAGDVYEAIDGILAARPDVVILDLNLEHGSGFDVLSKVHQREPAIGFYVLSNFASEAYRRHAERLGALGVFDKTHEFERVREVIRERTLCMP